MHPNEPVTLSQQQRAIIDLCREFGADEIRPAAHTAHEADVETPRELWRKAAKAGITAFMMPAEYGGGGLTGALTQCLAQEELAAGDATTAHLLTAGRFFAEPVIELGTEAQKERWLRPLTTDDPPVTALALAEPDLGSESAAITTKARRVGSGYKLSGPKMWIANAEAADFYLLFATIDSTRRAAGVTAFLVERGASGLTFGAPSEDRGGVGADVFLDEVFVPDNQRLGAEGQGFDGLVRTFDIARVTVAASAIGLARACFEVATAHAREHAAAGVPLVEMSNRVEASRALTWHAAGLIDAGDDATEAAVTARQHATETAVFCSAAASEILHGSGHAHEQLTRKWARDAKFAEVVKLDVTAPSAAEHRVMARSAA